MITIGRSIRWYNEFKSEADFSKENNFDFMQIWFQKGKILVDSLEEPREKFILENGFPVIIHAVFDIDDFEKYGEQLIDLICFFNHKEVIIHPVCEEKEITEQTIYSLAENVRLFHEAIKPHGVTLYIENNSVIDTINYTPHDLKILFEANPEVELLLDIAHIDNYEHLTKIIEIKYPRCLHIADKRFDVSHEHLPIGSGELDYSYIFSNHLKDFDGKIILEIVDEDSVVIDSKNKIIAVLK